MFTRHICDMIHVATVHWNQNDYKDIQFRHLCDNLEDFCIWAFVDGTATIDAVDRRRYRFCERADARLDRSHCRKLDGLAKMICGRHAVRPDDVLLFLDGDAWPVQPITAFIHDTLENYVLGAVVRTENAGDKHVHPCFCFTSVAFWREHRLSWRPGPTESEIFFGRRDVGGAMSTYLNENNFPWLRMLRTKSLGEHPVLFGVYDAKVYHHGAGFRTPRTMMDRIMPEAKITKELSMRMLEKLQNNNLDYH